MEQLDLPPLLELGAGDDGGTCCAGQVGQLGAHIASSVPTGASQGGAGSVGSSSTCSAPWMSQTKTMAAKIERSRQRFPEQQTLAPRKSVEACGCESNRVARDGVGVARRHCIGELGLARGRAGARPQRYEEAVLDEDRDQASALLRTGFRCIHAFEAEAKRRHAAQAHDRWLRKAGADTPATRDQPPCGERCGLQSSPAAWGRIVCGGCIVSCVGRDQVLVSPDRPGAEGDEHQPRCAIWGARTNDGATGDISNYIRKRPWQRRLLLGRMASPASCR